MVDTSAVAERDESRELPHRGTAVWYYVGEGEFPNIGSPFMQGVIDVVHDESTVDIIIVDGIGTNYRRENLRFVEDGDWAPFPPFCVRTGRTIARQ